MVVIFDVDGTLLDTFPHVRASYIHTLEKMLPNYKYTEEELKSFFGPTLPETFKSIVGDGNDKFVNALVDEYVSYSKTIAKEYLSVFPKTFETLEKLKSDGHILTVLSNKRTNVILEQFALVGILPYFDLIIGYNDVKHPKPDPEGIRLMQDKYQEECIFVGDTVYDMETARNAGITGVGVLWGLTSEEKLRLAGADYIINDYQELFEIIKGGTNV